MSIAFDFNTSSCAAIPASKRPVLPLRARPQPVVRLELVRGPAAERAASEGRKRRPQRAVGSDGRDATPSQFIDDNGDVILRDVMDRKTPPADIRHLYEHKRSPKGQMCWIRISDGKLWRGMRTKNGKHASKGVTTEVTNTDAALNAIQCADPEVHTLITACGFAEGSNGVTLSAGVGSIIDIWGVDFTDMDLHPELQLIPSPRRCRAVEETTGSYCCTSQRTEGSAYCPAHHLRYTRPTKAAPVRLGRIV